MKIRTTLLMVTCSLLAITTRVALAQTPYGPIATPPEYSGDLGEVVKLAKSGVDESVIIAYVQNSPVPNRPSADEILKLRDAGVSSRVFALI